jgi:hypothetical protein
LIFARGYPIISIEVIIVEKKCRKCSRVLPISEFTKNKRTPSGYDHWCKECNRADNHLSQKRKVLKELIEDPALMEVKDILKEYLARLGYSKSSQKPKKETNPYNLITETEQWKEWNDGRGIKC